MEQTNFIINDYEYKRNGIIVHVTLLMDSQIPGTYKAIATQDQSNTKLRVLIIAPTLIEANELLLEISDTIKDIVEILVWTQQPLYKWAKKKTENG